MPSEPLQVFEGLLGQVEVLNNSAKEAAAEDRLSVAEPMWRACIVLAVAALDTYMHERGRRLLHDRVSDAAGDVANYLQSVSVEDLRGPNSDGLIRLRLSYKTLVAPEKIDAMLAVSGADSEALWLHVALETGSRPDRLRALTSLQYDRRNQIAHEGDWDPISREFRRISDSHVEDCVEHVSVLAQRVDVYFEQGVA